MKMLILKCIKSMSRYFFLFIVVSFVSIVLRRGAITARRYKNYDIWKVINQPKDNRSLKYILIWSEGGPEWNCLRDQQAAFKDLNCQYDNCFVTKDMQLLGDYTKFDAILINGKTLVTDKYYELPRRRKATQLYIFATKESAAEYPVCDKRFDNYFNLTWTYRLDSDIPWTYFTVNDLEENVLGPKADIKWAKEYYPPPEVIDSVVNDKSLPAVWYVTKCRTKSRREFLVQRINTVLKRYGAEIEPIGTCGGHLCSPKLEDKCLKDLEKYYFYLAFEDSIAEDYVTDTVLKAFQNYVVPVVFGGANYSRFLPPNGYIDAGNLPIEDTAFKMAYLIRNKTAYMNHFRWYSHYFYTQNENTVCKLCEMLNKDMKKVYKNFGEWWNPKSFKSFGRKPTYNACSKLKYVHDMEEV